MFENLQQVRAQDARQLSERLHDASPHSATYALSALGYEERHFSNPRRLPPVVEKFEICVILSESKTGETTHFMVGTEHIVGYV